jgi:hypothetical protein
MYQNFIIPYLYEAQHVFGQHTAHHQEPKTAPAASDLSYTWKVVGRVVGLTTSTNYTSNSLPRTINQRLPVQF